VKIGIVSQSYYPRYGGVTEHVHHTAMELRRRGHDVTIITSRFRSGESTTAAGLERVGRNLLIPFNRAFVDFTVGLNLRRQLKRVFERHDFDVVHTHCPTSPSLPVIAIQSAACPQIATFHTTAPRSLLQDLFQDYLRGVVEKLDARIAVSATARASAEMYYPGEYHVIPNGVDIERFHPQVEPFAQWRDSDRVNILFVGRLDPRKGVPLLLQAMPEVARRTGGRARLLIVGDSYLRARYESSVPSSLRPHIHFLGHVPGSDLPRWYATGDVFVSPASGNESFGIVLIEAMAAGRAVVASDIPGYRSVVIPDVNGVVFPSGDAGALAATLSALVNDPEHRAQLAVRGRARALEFAWPRVTDQIEALYREVMSRRRAVHSAA
jgi:phosphatidyl-myo-inositol alpha-mannosyltransferase